MCNFISESGSVIHKLKSLPRQITGLSWCPTPFNIYGRQSKNVVMKPESKEWDQKMSDLASKLQAWRNLKHDEEQTGSEQTSCAELESVQTEMAKLSVDLPNNTGSSQDDKQISMKSEEVTPPSKVGTSPTKEVTSSTKQVTSPTKEAISPTKETICPTKEAISPKKEAISCTKEATSPTKETFTPSPTDDSIRISTNITFNESSKIIDEVFQNPILELDELIHNQSKSVPEDIEGANIVIPEYVKKNKPNPWINLVYVDDDELPSEYPGRVTRTVEERWGTSTDTIGSGEVTNKVSLEKVSTNTEEAIEENPTEKLQPKALFEPIDFAEECRLLREQILSTKAADQKSEAEGEQSLTSAVDSEERKILKAKRVVKDNDEGIEIMGEDLINKAEGDKIILEDKIAQVNTENAIGKHGNEGVSTKEKKAQHENEAQNEKEVQSEAVLECEAPKSNDNILSPDSKKTKANTLPVNSKTKPTTEINEFPLNEITNFSYRRESLLASIQADG